MSSDRIAPSKTSAAADRRTLRVSIILATLNERTNLPVLIENLRALHVSDSEMLVVDDGSADGTREYVERLSAQDSSIRLIRHDGKQTTLRAQCQGIDASQGDFIVVMDADLQHPAELVPQLLTGLDQGAALVIASRYAPGGSAGRRTMIRWVLSRGAEWMTKILLPSARRVSDPVSGFFAFRRDVWVPLNPLYRGYKLLLFLLVMAEDRPVREVGFQFTPRAEGASKVTGNTAFLRVFLTELILARRFRARIKLRARGQSEAGSSPTGVTLLH
jgi:dolichol-phosphate mannosyltransferase